MDRSSHHQAGLGDDSSDEKERDSRGDHITDSDETRSRACITVEEDFEFGKSHFGLADSQVRHYTPICRHLALSMAALAVCAVTAALARPRPSTLARPPTSPDDLPPEDPGLIALTVAEVKRVFNLLTRDWQSIRHYLRWSWWRRRHQARARWFHQRARLRRRATDP